MSAYDPKQTSSKCGRFDLIAQSASRWIEDTVRPVIALESYGAASKLLLDRAAGARKQIGVMRIGMRKTQVGRLECDK